MGERVGGPGHGPKTIKDCFGSEDNYFNPDESPVYPPLGYRGHNWIDSIGDFVRSVGANILLREMVECMIMELRECAKQRIHNLYIFLRLQ